MSAAMVDQNPDYSYRMNSQRPYSPQQHYHQDPDIRTSAYVSDSDLQYADRQERIRGEMKREYEDHVRRKEELENRRREELYRRRSQSPAKPQTELYDHNEMAQQLREERRREYNDLMKERETKSKPPPTPPVGLDIPTEQDRKRIVELKKKQYRDELLMQQKEQILNKVQHQPEIQVLDRRNQQPPPQHDMRRSQDSQRYRAPSPRWEPEMYKRETFAPDQQQNPMAKPSIQEMGKPSIQEMGKPYIQETGFGSEEQKSTKVPQRMDEDFQNLWYGNYKREPFRKASPRLLSPPHQANIGNEEEYHSTRRKKEHEDRRKEYNDFLQMKKETENEKKMQIEKQRNQPPAQIIKGDYYSSEQYDKRRQQLHDQEHREYQKFLERNDIRSNRVATPEFLQGLPLTQKKYDVVRQQREKERNKEYNDYLSSKQTPRTDRTNRKKEYSNDPPGAVLFDGEYKRVKEKVREERTRDYHTYLEKKQQEFSRKSGDFGEGNNTFFNNLGHSMDQRKEQLIKERNDDYRRHLQDDQPRYQSPPRDDRRSRPNSYQNGPQTPSYQDMLQDKRRQEDSYRRYADPEYNARPGDRY